MESLIRIPQRIPLASRTADSLRDAIRGGEWHDFLPGAEDLARRLQVSHTTLKKALKILSDEGLIAQSRGHLTRILPDCREKRKLSRQRSKVVVFLVAAPPWEVSRLIAFARSELEHDFHLAGFEVREINDYRFANEIKTKFVDRIVHQIDAACWVLFDSNHAQQLYFSDRALPAFIVGHRYPNVKLPFLDLDFNSICRHATRRLLGAKHRRLALLLPDIDGADMLAREQGFRDEIASFGRNATGIVLRHHKTAGYHIDSVLDSAFQKTSRPTGLIVADAWHAVTAVSHLIYSGVHVPRDVSVISTDFELVLHAFRPKIASYWIDHDAYAISLSRLVIQLAKTGSLSLKPNWVLPRPNWIKINNPQTVAPPTEE